jgi:RNA polymerase sigma factor for flagellar operon FliA
MRVRSSVTELDDLWAVYKAPGDPALCNRLMLQSTPLVRYVAGRVRSSLPGSVDQADLISEGVIALMDAIEGFELRRGRQFQTYAVWRIRGAIIDSLRAIDWYRDQYGTRSALGVVDSLAPASGDALEEHKTRTALVHAVRGLAERDAIIIALYYSGGLALAEIGMILHVSESRICQLYTATLALRASLKASTTG